MTTGPIRPERRIDAEIRKNAADLFELDDTSRLILASIARGGPQTIYELDKNVNGLSKASIHRRLYGDGLLLKQKFLRLEGTVSFGRIKGREKKYYGLDLKGFLASLSKVRCEENYMFKILQEATYDYYIHLDNPTEFPHWKEWATKERNDFDLKSRKRMKIDLWTFLSYHANQGLKLTWITNPLMYYLSSWTTLVTPSDIAPDLSASREATKDIGEQSAMFLWPWMAPFIACWVTWQTKGDIREHLDKELMLALLIAYGKIMRELHDQNDPPWDYGVLLTGKPLRELKKRVPELSGA
jgi:hypothetical protein